MTPLPHWSRRPELDPEPEPYEFRNIVYREPIKLPRITGLGWLAIVTAIVYALGFAAEYFNK